MEWSPCQFPFVSYHPELHCIDRVFQWSTYSCLGPSKKKLYQAIAAGKTSAEGDHSEAQCCSEGEQVRLTVYIKISYQTSVAD